MMSATKHFVLPPIKEIVHLTNSVLYPPNPNVQLPATTCKPSGCKTVYIHGLPEKATQETVKEIFERCGVIETIRMFDNRVCEITFSEEKYVENAIYFSGYEIKIENKDEFAYTGILYVSFLGSIDDYRSEPVSFKLQNHCQDQDHYQSSVSHEVYINQNSSSEVEHNLKIAVENLQIEKKFAEALEIITTCIEKGFFQDTGVLYSILQITNSLLQDIQIDKFEDKEGLNEAKEMMKIHADKYTSDLSLIAKIYEAATVQENWEQFTEAQRKDIETWKKEVEEMKSAHERDVIQCHEEIKFTGEGKEGEKEFVEICEEDRKKMDERKKLLEEHCALKCRLKDLENELAAFLSKREKELKDNAEQLERLQLDLENAPKGLISFECQHELSRKNFEDGAQQKEFCSLKRKADDLDDTYLAHKGNEVDLGTSANTSSSVILQNEARLIALISTFLSIHKCGASFDSICSYLQEIDSTFKARDVESLLKRYPSIYQEDSSETVKKWHFKAFSA